MKPGPPLNGSETTLIRVSLNREGTVARGGLELLESWNRDSKECVWVDIQSTQAGDIEPLLEEWFGFHELAAEDSVSGNTLPKYDLFPGYDFFVFRSIDVNLREHGVKSVKLACFLGKNFLFTIHGEKMAAIESVWERLAQDARLIRRGVDFLLHAVLDVMVDSHFPLLDEIEERTDHIHELIFDSPSQDHLDELLKLKRDLNVLRRQTLPQRELLNAISRGDAQFIQKQYLIYFRDLYDHMFRIGESIDVERDLATSTMEAYLSVIANRTNDIMKVLTMISTVLLPMNFIAGLYGMNFLHMPELKWHYGYLWALSLMGMAVIAMVLWFRRLGWLGHSTVPKLQKDHPHTHVRQRLSVPPSRNDNP